MDRLGIEPRRPALVPGWVEGFTVKVEARWSITGLER